ncbi:GNAT family N-acetyltransferase [Terrimonas pollutisoli]|uniref:GNAT family N-acetyltransferase n=1 Tax=Terrimonas pollutisoli TaxID=3034147 RepID=UPI0023ECB54B|nr:GNAT family N-acetyltransferase [Terrimonas sp. H1YJ31]
MRLSLANGKTVTVRHFEPGDSSRLLNYLVRLSAESRSRFGPHAFDQQTIGAFSTLPDNTIQRFIALDETGEGIIAYMLVKRGLIEHDQQRYGQRNLFYDYNTTVTYAPSVADDWQSSGLGTAMHKIIEEELIKQGVRQIILWGGVQASNEKALNFYKKNGYHFIASFWHDGKDNYDMVKEIT